MQKNAKYILYSFVVVAIALRIYNLGFQCFWTEELFTLQIASTSTQNIISQSILSDFNPPVYYILAHFFDMRVISAVAGILLIPVMYAIGDEYAGEISGLWCAGIASVLFPLVYYSQYGRSYSLSILVFAITYLLYMRVMNDRGYQIAFVVVAALTIWIHLFNAIPVSLLCISLACHGRIFPAVFTGVLCSPLLISLKSVISDRTTGLTYGMDIPTLLYVTPSEFFGSSYLLLIPAAIYGIYKEYSVLFESATICYITIAVGMALSSYTPFFPRYYLPLISIVILFVAMGFYEHTKDLPLPNQYLIILLIVSAIFFLQCSDYISQYTIQKYSC